MVNKAVNKKIKVMSKLPKHREQEWILAINNCNKKAVQGEVEFLDMDIVWDMDLKWSFGTTKTTIAKGDIVRINLFKSLGFEKSTKKEATLVVIIGKQINGAWIVGETKFYWLKQSIVQ